MKKLLSLVMAGVMALSMAACGAQPASTPASGDPSSAPEKSDKKPTTVTVWHMLPEDSKETCVHQRLLKWADDFNKTNTDNITVKVSGAKTADVILTTIASGATPDIFQTFWNNAPAWSDKGALYDLTDFVNNDKEWDKSDFVDSLWGLCTYNDKIYSIPMTISTTFMAYRPDLLAEAGWDHFPKDTDELLQCAIDCTKVDENGKITQMGLIPDYPWLDPVLWSAAFGAEWVDENGKPNFNNPEQLAAYNFQKAIYDKFGYDEVRRFIDTLGQRASTEDPIFKGKVAMRFNADNGLSAMINNGQGVDWAIAPIPTAKNGGQMLAAGTWGVNAKTADPEATWKVLSSLTSKENMEWLANGDLNGGAFMPRKSALNYVINDLDCEDYIKENAKTLLNDPLIHFPMLSYIGEYLNAISTEMATALRGETTVEDAAANIQAQLTELAG